MFENIWKYIRLRTCPWSISKTSPSFCSSVLKAPHKNKLWQMWPKYFKLFSKIFYICGNNYTKLLWKQNYLLFVYLREYHHLHLSKFCERFLISHNRLSGNRYPLSPILDISLNLISYWLQISYSARCRYALNIAHHTRIWNAAKYFTRNDFFYFLLTTKKWQLFARIKGKSSGGGFDLTSLLCIYAACVCISKCIFNGECIWENLCWVTP